MDCFTTSGLLQEARNTKSQKAKRARKKLYYDYATKIICPLAQWSARHVIDFVVAETNASDKKNRLRRHKPIENKTIEIKATQLMAFLLKKGNSLMKHGSGSRARVAGAIAKLNQTRSYMFQNINEHKQAKLLTMSQLTQLMKFLLAQKASQNKFVEHRRCAVILILLFSHMAPC